MARPRPPPKAEKRIRQPVAYSHELVIDGLCCSCIGSQNINEGAMCRMRRLSTVTIDSWVLRTG